MAGTQSKQNYGKCPTPDADTHENLWFPDNPYDIVTGAAQWGWDQAHAAMAQRPAAPDAQAAADAELEACCEWLAGVVIPSVVSALRAARRPPAPSARDAAIKALRERLGDGDGTPITDEDASLLKLALRALEGGDG